MFYKKQKQFNVAIINFKNFSTYVQRKIDIIFCVYKVFVRVYVNNVIIFSYTLKKHITYLHIIFVLFESFNIILSFKKFFFDYFTVALLNQKINAFDLTTTTNKLKVILKLDFFYTLKNLKNYFDFID